MNFGLFGSNNMAETAAVDARSAASAVATPPLPSIELPTIESPPLELPVAKDGASSQNSVSPPSEEACPNCGSSERWGLSPWCPHCFYYPKLDAVMIPEGETDALYDSAHDRNPADFDSVPMWARILGAGVMVIFLASMAAAVLLPAEDPIREYWTLTQAGLGLLAAGMAHILAFLNAVPQTDRFEPFDIVVHPFEVWGPTVVGLPKRAWRLWQAVWGLTAALWALTLIGGVQYSAIFEGYETETKQRTNAASDPVACSSKKHKKDLDAAKRKHHQTAKASEQPSKIEPIKTEPAARRHAECVIVGYVKSPTGGFSSILLGSYIGGRLTYVGSLSASEIPADVRITLRDRLPRLERSKPVLKTSRSATWLRPVMSCRIGFKDLTASKTFNEPQFSELLDEADDRSDETSGGRRNP